MIKKFTSIAALALATSAVHAQVTTSSLSGVVMETEQEGAIGALVRATHLPSGTQYQTVTQYGGLFFLDGMRSGGPYRVEVEHLGFNSKIVDDIFLVLGETYNLTVDMAGNRGVEIQEVVIIGTKDPVLNSNRTGASTNINNTTITRMPTVSRSLTDFTRLTPQANGNGFAGRDGRFNNLQIDGANFNNAFGLSSNPLPGGSNQPISLDAIQEVSVNIAPYDVRQTGFTGAGINAVTRSGTNEIEGSVYTYFRPKSFTGLRVGEDTLNKLSRMENLIVGARLGAPIIKNKLFVFGSFEYENSKSAGNSWVADDGTNTGQPNTTRVLKSDLEAVSSYLISNYNYDPGAYQGYANNYLNKNYKGLLRLDWNINTNNRFTIRYNIMNGTSDQGTNGNSGPNPRSSSQRISSESISFENANYSFKNTVSSITAELNSTLRPDLSNQFLATYSHIQDSREAPGSIFPFVDIWKDGANYISFGTELFSHENDVINNNITITDNITYLLNKHTFTGGLSFQTMSFANSYKRMGTSYYRYNDLGNFLSGGAPDVYGVTYPYAGNDGYARVKFGLAGLYLQDKYTVNNQFNITGGIRMDIPLFLDNPPANPEIEKINLLDENGNETTYTTGSWPKSTPLFSPRVGFNYDVFGDRTLQLRGGTGIFSGNIPFVWFTNMPTNSGTLQNTFEPVDSATLSQITGLNADPMYWVNQLPSRFPSSPTKAPGSFAVVAPNFKMPQVWRTSIGGDYKIPNTPLLFTADILFTKDLVGVYQFNANRKAATGNLNFENDNRDYWATRNDATFNRATGSIIPVLSNHNEGYSFSTTLGLTMRERDGFFGSLFYTYSDAKDVTGNPGSAANSGWSNNYSVNDPNELRLGLSQYAVPHRVVGNVSYRFEYARNFATTLSLFYQGSHQGRFAYTYSNDANNDGVSLDLLYVPNDLSAMRFDPIVSSGTTLFTADEQRAAFENLINDQKGLSKYRGDYVERNSGLMPWLNRWDFRIMQDFFVNVNDNRHTLQLSLDIMNLGNLLNSDWGLYKQLNMGSDYNYGLMKVVSVDANGVPTYQMNTVTEAGQKKLPTTPFRNAFSTASTWGMQFGVRYIF